MKKAIFACVLAILCLSVSSYAVGMSCSIADTAACAADTNKEVIFTISDLADGGSHALPSGEAGAFPKSVCCSGVAGLTANVLTIPPESVPGTFSKFVGYFASGHFNRTGSFSVFSKALWLEAPTQIDCGYSTASCTPGYDTCLFTISEDSSGYSHVSGCGTTEYPFDNSNNYNYCCRQGVASCDITDTAWAIIDQSDPEHPVIDLLEEDEDPIGPKGGGFPILLIVYTNGNCEGSKVDFTIKKDGTPVIGLDPYKNNIVLGTLDDGSDSGDPAASAALWETPSGVANTGIYTFEVSVHNEAVEPDILITETSPRLRIEGDGCRATVDKTWFEETCGAEFPLAECEAQCDCTPEGLCTNCIDSDCDRPDGEGVADCIDEFLGIVTDPAMVDSCGGGERGTAGCVPAMDCTNLLWSECKNCEAGQDCDTVGDFDAGTMFMERCEGMGSGCVGDLNENGEFEEDAGKCCCQWMGAMPPECTADNLDQSDNRFKECIEDEEFPFFDGFNVIAVLLVLSLYYAIVIVRKKK